MQTTIAENSAARVKFAVIGQSVDGDFMRRLQRLGKRSHKLSARGVAEKFGVTRATFKAWETGKKVITEENARRAQSLYREWAGDAQAVRSETRERTRDVIKITFARGCDARMRTLKIFRKPRKCRVCGNWFEPSTSRQMRCSGCVADKRTGAKRRKTK